MLSFLCLARPVGLTGLNSPVLSPPRRLAKLALFSLYPADLGIPLKDCSEFEELLSPRGNTCEGALKARCGDGGSGPDLKVDGESFLSADPMFGREVEIDNWVPRCEVAAACVGSLSSIADDNIASGVL